MISLTSSLNNNSNAVQPSPFSKSVADNASTPLKPHENELSINKFIQPAQITAPKFDTPAVQAPADKLKIDTPQVVAPLSSEKPQFDTPVVQAPIEKPQFDTPAVQAPIQKPDFDAPTFEKAQQDKLKIDLSSVKDFNDALKESSRLLREFGDSLRNVPDAVPPAPMPAPSAPPAPPAEDGTPKGTGGGGAGIRVAKQLVSAGASSDLASAVGSIPQLALMAGNLGILNRLGRQAQQVELPFLQAQAQYLDELPTGAGFYQQPIRKTVFDLSDRLGISPSQATSILKDVGFAQAGTQNRLSTAEISSLSILGFDPVAIATAQGALQGAGVQGGVMQAFAGGAEAGLRGQNLMSFVNQTNSFAIQRKQAGLSTENVGMTASRAVNISPDSALLSFGTMQRTQNIGLRAGAGLTSMFGGMSESILQAYAMSKAGGDVFEASRILEDLSGKADETYSAVLSMGVGEDVASQVLLGSGLTTNDVERLREASRFTVQEIPTTELDIDAGKELSISRSFARKERTELALASSNSGKIKTLLAQETRFERSALERIPSGEAIKNITTGLIGLNKVVSIATVPAFEALATTIKATTTAVAGIKEFFGVGGKTPAKKQRKKQVEKK